MEELTDLFKKPAFPLPEYLEYSRDQEGITILDYFITRAPANPPKWWKPVMPEKPSKLKKIDDEFSGELEQNYLLYWDTESEQFQDNNKEWIDRWIGAPPEDVCHAPEEFKEKIFAHIKMGEQQLMDINAWEQQLEYETLIQWPYWWATQMLKRRAQYIK